MQKVSSNRTVTLLLKEQCVWCSNMFMILLEIRKCILFWRGSHLVCTDFTSMSQEIILIINVKRLVNIIIRLRRTMVPQIVLKDMLATQETFLQMKRDLPQSRQMIIKYSFMAQSQSLADHLWSMLTLMILDRLKHRNH